MKKLLLIGAVVSVTLMTQLAQGADLPAEYREMSSLTAKVGEYVDTGFKPNQDTRVVMKVSVRSVREYWFGAWNSAYNDGAFAMGNDAGNIYTGYDGQGGGLEYAGGTVLPVGDHTIDMDKNVVKIDDVVHRTFLYAGNDFQVNYPLYLFAQNRQGTKIAAPMSSDGIVMYSCQIYDNGELVRDYVPCYLAAAPEKVGLYDLKNDEFVALITETTHSGVLPAEYQEVLYVAADIGAYINTDFKPNQDTRVVMKVSVQGAREYWFGAWNGGYNNGAFAMGNDGGDIYNGYDGQGGGKTYSGGTVLPVGIHTIDVDKNSVRIDDALHRVFTYEGKEFQVNYSLYLFAQNRKGVKTPAPGATAGIVMYSCQIYDNGELVRDYVPCYLIAEPERVGLYDVKNGVFKENSDTKTKLVAGPPVGGVFCPLKVTNSDPDVPLSAGLDPAVGETVAKVGELYEAVVNNPETLSADGMTKYVLSGWELTVTHSDESVTVTSNGTDNVALCTMTPADGDVLALKWLWRREYLVTTRAYGAVTVDHELLWVRAGETCELTATSEDEVTWYYADVTEDVCHSKTVSFTVDNPRGVAVAVGDAEMTFYLRTTESGLHETDPKGGWSAIRGGDRIPNMGCRPDVNYIVTSGLWIGGPNTAADFTFPGKSVTLEDKSDIGFHQTGSHILAIPELIVTGNATFTALGTPESRLDGTCTINDGASLIVKIPYGLDFEFMGKILGSGTVGEKMDANPSACFCRYSGDLSGFSGSFDFAGRPGASWMVTNEFTSASAFPADPAEFTTTGLKTANGIYLTFTASGKFGPNRGFTFADRPVIYVAEGERVEIAGPIAGTQGFVKTGPGKLVLSGKSQVSGVISVEEGTLSVLGAKKTYLPNADVVVSGSAKVNYGAGLMLIFK